LHKQQTKFQFLKDTEIIQHKMKNTLIAPSYYADFGNLQRDIEMINNSEADWFHIDIMDCVFVLTFHGTVLEAINKHAKKKRLMST
jgi:ribulose-phosphate 3-epimerase